MSTSILLPGGSVPTNLHLNPNTDKVRLVTSDMYHICERIREISPALYILELERETEEGRKYGFAIMEHCVDGVDRLVIRCSKDKLDKRQLDRLGYIMSLDLHARLEVLDVERERWEAEQHDNELEKLYEQMGGQMHRDLARNGFIDTFPTSYRPLNRTARRHLQHRGRRRVMDI